MPHHVLYAGQNIPIDDDKIDALRQAVQKNSPGLLSVTSDGKYQIAVGAGLPIVVIKD